jgi:hypothetical protein
MTTRYNFAEADKFCDEIQSYLLTKEDLLLLDMGISNTGLINDKLIVACI